METSLRNFDDDRRIAELREEDVDGTSVIIELQDDVYLTVNPPEGAGKRVTIETIRQQLIEKQVSSPIDFEIVKQAVEICSGEAIKISSVDGERVKLLDTPQEEKACLELAKPYRKEQAAKLDLTSTEDVRFASLRLPTPQRAYGKVAHRRLRLTGDSEEKSWNISRMATNIKGAIGVGNVDVTISEDGMKAYITVHSLPKKNKVTYIMDKLKKEGVIYGIDKERIFDVIRNNLFSQPVWVARGEAPIEGKNAELIYKFDINRKSSTQIEHKGNIDYYYLDSASSVKKNQVLVEKKPPVLAEMGMSVKKYNIEPANSSAQDVLLPAGKNTVISEDVRYAHRRLRLTGAKLLAAIDGYLYFSDGKLNVGSNYMVVKGDVDASIGNIYFQGDVFITGNVFEGFVVEADGNIEIQGRVHEASLNSKDGNIIIRKDSYKSNVEASGDIRIKMAEESVIHAKGNVLIDEDLLNCVVMGEKKVSVNGGEGIVGGEVYAGMEITANSIGAPKKVPTMVQIVEKDSELSVKLFLLERKMKDALEKLSGLAPELTTNTPKELLLSNIKEYIAQKKRVDELKSEQQELLEGKRNAYLMPSSRQDSAPRSSKNKTIRVTDTIYSDVEIRIGEIEERIKEQEPGGVFFRDGHFIEVEELFQVIENVKSEK